MTRHTTLAVLWLVLLHLLVLVIVDCESMQKFGVRPKTNGGQLYMQATKAPEKAKQIPNQTQVAAAAAGRVGGGGSPPVPPPGAMVFIGNLPFTITEADVEYLLKTTLGSTRHTAIRIARGQKTKRPLGFLFVDFKDAESAEKCVAITNGMDVWGRTLNSNIKEPEGAKAKREPIRDHIVYLSNLDYSLTEVEILNMCEDLVGPGLALEVKIPLDKNRDVPRGFAHIEFKDAAAVAAAIASLNGVEVFSRQLKAERLVAPPKKAPPVDDPVNRNREEGGGSADGFNVEEDSG